MRQSIASGVRALHCVLVAAVTSAAPTTILAQGGPGQGPPPGPPEHQPATYGIVYKAPGMDQAQVRADLPYKTVEGTTLVFDLYRPGGGRSSGGLPVIVFLDMFGDPPGAEPSKTWGQYTSWPRLAAARGYAGISFTSRPSDSVSDARDLLHHLESHADELGIDSARIGVWICSGHVRTGLPALMEGRLPQAKVAVVYYGGADLTTFRKDLPVLLVRAGRDRPMINETVDRLIAAAASANAPWTVINATGLHHAFDCLDDLDESRRVIFDTMAWFDRHLRPEPLPGVEPSLAREALSYWFAQEFPEAADAYARYVQAHPDDLVAIHRLGTAQIRTERYDDAIRTFESMRGREGLKPALITYNIACAHALKGETDKAIAALERAVDEGFDSAQGMQEDPDLAGLRGDPRFVALQERLSAK